MSEQRFSGQDMVTAAAIAAARAERERIAADLRAAGYDALATAVADRADLASASATGGSTSDLWSTVLRSKGMLDAPKQAAANAGDGPSWDDVMKRKGFAVGA